MSIFAVLSFPLAASLAISLRGAEIFVPSRRGLLVGTAWFILWAVLRIVLSDFLVPEPMPLEIYGNYTVFLLGVPLLILCLSPSLKMRRSTTVVELEALVYDLQARLASFLFLNGLLDCFLFPIPGDLSRLFVYPVFRIALAYLVPRVLVSVIRGKDFERWGSLALFLVLLAVLNLGLIAEFYRRFGMVWFHLGLCVVLMLGLHEVRALGSVGKSRLIDFGKRIGKFLVAKARSIRPVGPGR